MFLFPQNKRLPDSSSGCNSPPGSSVFSKCSQRHLLGPFLWLNGIPQPKKGMERRGEDVWVMEKEMEEMRCKRLYEEGGGGEGDAKGRP